MQRKGISMEKKLERGGVRMEMDVEIVPPNGSIEKAIEIIKKICEEAPTTGTLRIVVKGVTC